MAQEQRRRNSLESYEKETPYDSQDSKEIEDMVPAFIVMDKKCRQICAADCTYLRDRRQYKLCNESTKNVARDSVYACRYVAQRIVGIALKYR